jgi:hypothetical protein
MRRTAHVKLVNDYFTANEIARVNASAVETRNLVIHAIWSAKEASLKAWHKGLRVDTRAVEIALAPFERAPAEWMLFQIRCGGADFVPPLQGWWRVQGDFVLTLAANLHTLPDTTELLPEACLVTHAPVRHAHTPHRIGHTPHHAAHHEN